MDPQPKAEDEASTMRTEIILFNISVFLPWKMGLVVTLTILVN
jgi:hypothetical protein